MQNEIVFKIKTGCYLQLLTPKMMKLPRRTNFKIIKDRNGENVPYLEIIEVVLVHFNAINKHYQHDSRVLYTFVPNKSSGQLLHFFT